MMKMSIKWMNCVDVQECKTATKSITVSTKSATMQNISPLMLIMLHNTEDDRYELYKARLE